MCFANAMPYVVKCSQVMIDLVFCRYIDEEDKADFEKNCHSYFMEVISSLCFGQCAIPEPELIKMLMQIVFEDNQTRDLTFNADGKMDRKPTIRSPLLQLLLQYRYCLAIPHTFL